LSNNIKPGTLSGDVKNVSIVIGEDEVGEGEDELEEDNSE
jgi:hypothetical protein